MTNLTTVPTDAQPLRGMSRAGSIVYIRLAFKKGSDNIHVGFTQLGNKTLTGEIMASDDLIVNHQMSFTNLSGEGAIGKVGTVCIASDEEADALIDKIDAIQAARSINARGNKYPFVYLKVSTEGTIIFNRGLDSGPDRLTLLDVELIEVHGNPPDAVVQIEKPIVSVPSSVEDVKAASRYGTVNYRAVRKLRAQNNIAKASANIANGMSAPSNVDETPSFNTKTVEVSVEPQQDKLNAIAVAMRAAGMSGLEIAQALKVEMSLV